MSHIYNLMYGKNIFIIPLLIHFNYKYNIHNIALANSYKIYSQFTLLK